MSSHSPIPLFSQEESNTGGNIFLNSTENNSLALPPLPQYIRLLLQNGYGIDSDRNLALLESLLQTRNIVVTDRKQYLRLYRVWSVLQRMESSGLRQLPYSDSVVSQEDEVACALHYKTGAPIFFSSQRRLLRQITGWLSDISAESLDESEGDQESIDQNEDEEDDASRTSSSDDFFQNQMLNSNRSHAQPAPPKLHPTKQQGQEALEQLLEKLVLRGEIERSAALALWHGYADHCVSLLCRAASQLRLAASKLATLSQEGVLEREEMADVYDLVAACVAGFQVKEECRSVIPHVQNETKDKTPSALTAGANVANSSTTSERNATNKSDTNTTDSGHKSSSVAESEHEESRWGQTCNRLLIRLSRLHQQRCSSYPAQNSHTYSTVTKNTNNDTCQNANAVLFQYEEESIAYLTAICRFLLANERSDIRTKRSEAYSHFLYNTVASSSVETNNVGRDSGNAYYSKRAGSSTSKSFPVARICVTDTLAFAATYLDFQALRSTVTQLLWRRDTDGTLPVDIERICVSSGVVGVSQGVSLLVSHLRQSGDTATPALLLSRCITDSETYLTAPLHLPHTQSSLMLNSSVNNNNTAATLQSMSVAQRRLQQQQENVLWLKKLAAACVQLLRVSLHRIYSDASSPISPDRQWALLCRGRLDRDIAKRLQESLATQQQQQQQVSQLPPNTSSTTPLSASASVASNFYSSRFNNSNTNINASLTPAPIITSGLALLHKELWEALNRRTSMALAVGDHSVLQHSLFGNTASSHNKGYHSNSDLLTAAATSTAQYSHNGVGQSSQHNNSTTNGMSEQQREETTAWMLCQQLTAAVLRFSISNSRNNIANSSNVNASLPLDTHLGVCASALLCRVCRRPISTSKSNTGAHLLVASNGELSPAITGLSVGDVSVGNTPSVPTTTSIAQGSVEVKDDTTHDNNATNILLNNSHNELQEEELLLVGLCLHCRASLPACFVCDLPLVRYFILFHFYFAHS